MTKSTHLTLLGLREINGMDGPITLLIKDITLMISVMSLSWDYGKTNGKRRVSNDIPQASASKCKDK
jgi:hypothetical protein